MVGLLIAVAVMCVAFAMTFGVGYLVAYMMSCPDGPSVADAPDIIAREKIDFLRDAKKQYVEQLQSQLQVKLELHLQLDDSIGMRRPISVTKIVGRNATLRLESEMYEGNYYYGYAWKEVYQKYHPNLKVDCVNVTFTYPKGTFVQPCCSVMP